MKNQTGRLLLMRKKLLKTIFKVKKIILCSLFHCTNSPFIPIFFFTIDDEKRCNRLFQEVLLQSTGKCLLYQGEISFQNWLLQNAYQAVSLDLSSPLSSFLPGKIFSKSRHRKANQILSSEKFMAQCLQKLPFRERSIIVLHKIMHMPILDVSRITGKNIQSVMRSVESGFDKLIVGLTMEGDFS